MFFGKGKTAVAARAHASAIHRRSLYPKKKLANAPRGEVVAGPLGAQAVLARAAARGSHAPLKMRSKNRRWPCPFENAKKG